MSQSVIKALKALIAGTRLGAYPATVRGTRPDGTVEVDFDDVALRGRGSGGIRLGLGLPESTAQIDEGVRVLVEFEGGDPDKPIISAFEFARDTSTLKIGESPRGVARDGDVVTARIDGGTTIAGIASVPSAAVAAAIAAGGGSVQTLPPLTPFTLTLGPSDSVDISGRISVQRITVCA